MAQQYSPAEAFAPFQQALTRGWGQSLNTFQSLGSVTPQGAGKLGADWQLPSFSFDTGQFEALRETYMKEAADLWRNGVAGESPRDRRFSAKAWGSNPLASFAAAVYLLNARTMLGLADAVQSDKKTRARVRFAVEQWLAAAAPSNYLALNPDAQQKAIETRGESIAKGIQNLFSDMKQGHVSMTDESLFEVGRNVARTEGAVVFETELFQLIEYKPLTAKVHERPFLFVPPCINKFYILDLQPENSMVRHMVEQGHHVFMVSWRNADESLRNATWDDYIGNGAIRAIETVLDITGRKQLNVLGFCVGGTILTTALAVLAARGEHPAASLTLLTTFLDFTDTGILDIFIDEQMVQHREMQMGKGGLLPGSEMATTFSFLRPNDLVWNYVVGNYLKGETPPPFDLLYWNSDATNLPGPFYAWMLRNTYHENNLMRANALTVCGEKINLNKLDLPTFIYGSRDDHIVPITGAYASTQLLPGKKRFVMGASGHIAGVINPPAHQKRSHWTRDDGKFPKTVDEWRAGAQEHPGSWWPVWTAWLEQHAGRQVAAPKGYGRGTVYKAIEPAPGRYVKVKA